MATTTQQEIDLLINQLNAFQEYRRNLDIADDIESIGTVLSIVDNLKPGGKLLEMHASTVYDINSTIDYATVRAQIDAQIAPVIADLNRQLHDSSMGCTSTVPMAAPGFAG